MSDLKPFKCWETTGPDSEDPNVYLCNVKKPHVFHHSESAPNGEVIAAWCSCPECEVARIEGDEPL